MVPSVNVDRLRPRRRFPLPWGGPISPKLTQRYRVPPLNYSRLVLGGVGCTLLHHLLDYLKSFRTVWSNSDTELRRS